MIRIGSIQIADLVRCLKHNPLMTINFPSKAPGGPPEVFEPPCRVVVVGANGSGKTRFGIWLEDNNHNNIAVHRIGAQKALAIPEFAQPKNLEQAQKDLSFGRSDQHASYARRVHDRWGGNAATSLLSDYEHLLALIFASTGERDRAHTNQTRLTGQYIPVPDSPIDQIVRVWEYLMPHRAINFNDGKVLVGKGTASEYHAKEMSDGERVTLYLLGQCLCAPNGSMLVIDEPELHLHRSLMDKLWNKVEELCPDKTIVYITHDLDFAASRTGAKKLWIQSFNGSAWTWLDIPTDEALPEALVMEIIGNRKPLLFCEGDRGGLDYTIYQLCFPHLHVVPRGGSEKVIEATKALRANPALHTFAAHGVVDLDVRSEREVAALEGQGVHVLKLAEIENLLCVEGLVDRVAAQLSLDPTATLAAVTHYVLAAIAGELEAQVAMRAERRVRYHLSTYSATTADESGLTQGLANLLATLDIPAAVVEARKTISDAVASGRLNEVLTVYNRKSLADRISTCFGLKNEEYTALVLRLLKGANGTDLSTVMRSFLPAL